MTKQFTFHTQKNNNNILPIKKKYFSIKYEVKVKRMLRII